MNFANEKTIDVLSRVYNGINENKKIQVQGINFVVSRLENDFHKSGIYHGTVQDGNKNKIIFQTKEDVIATFESTISGMEFYDYAIRLQSFNNDLKEKTSQINDSISTYIKNFMESRRK